MLWESNSELENSEVRRLWFGRLVLHPEGPSSGSRDRAHPSFWGVLDQTCESLPTPGPRRCSVADPVPCTLTTRGGGAGKQTDELPFIERSVEYQKTMKCNLTEWCENIKKTKKTQTVISFVAFKEKNTLLGIMLYAAVVMLGGVCSNYCLPLSKAVDSLSSN